MLGPCNIYVKLPSDVADGLVRVSRRSGLHPKQQAARLIAEGLERLGEHGDDELAPESPDRGPAAYYAGPQTAERRLPLASKTKGSRRQRTSP